jgi:two-component sensor histidine kinase
MLPLYISRKILITAILLVAQSAIGQKTIKQIDKLNEQLWDLLFTNPDSAVVLGQKIENASKNINYLKGLADAKSRIGVTYDIQGMQEKALPYFLDAIKLHEKLKDSVGLAFDYNNLGLMYYAQYDYEPARKYIEKSLQIDSALGNKSEMAGSLVNLGIIYTYLDQFDKSLSLYGKSLDLYTQLKDSAGIMAAYTNMAKVYYAKKEYEKSLKYNLINESYLQRNNSHPERFSAVYNSLANIYLKLENHSKAMEYALRDLHLCRENKLTYRRQFAYETLSDVYTDQGNFSEANRYLKYYVALRDSILNEDKNSQIAEMQIQYETEKKDNELLKVKLEKETESAKVRTQKIILLVSMIIFIIVLIFILIAYRSKQRINLLLDEKNRLNEEVINQKQLMIGEIHHRVKNNLQLINSMIGLESRTLNDNETKQVIDNIQKRVNAISLLHQFLYDKEALEQVDMISYIRQLGEGLKKSFGSHEKQINILYEIDPIKIGTDGSVSIGLIINELITNSFKHAFPENGGTIIVRLFKTGNYLILEVEDNGKGKDEDAAENKSFGTMMITSLCRQLDASWEIEFSNGMKNIFEIKKIKYVSDNE